MLEGLEVKEVNYLKAFSNKDFRIDTDFWTKEPKLNPKLKYGKIGKYLLLSQYGISIEMNEDKIGYPIYRMNEIHNMLCDFDVAKYADINIDELNIFRLNDRDVLFNRTNSFEWVGRTGIYHKTEKNNFVFASYLVRFIPDPQFILPEYLTTYLNTKYGVWDVKRRARQSINQTNVNPEEIKEVDIPLLNMKIQNYIKNNFDISISLLEQSKSLYTQAEQLLLEELGLKGWQPSVENINEKSFKESFLSTGRLDAEYYQPKYEEIENKLQQNHSCDLLGNIILKIDTGEYSEEYLSKGDKDDLAFYIRSTNIKNGIIELDDSYYVEKDKFVRKAKVGDIVTSRVGSVGLFGEVRDKLENSVYSDNILCFRLPSTFKPNVYTLLFNTEFYFELIDRFARGSVQQRLNQETLKDLIIPYIDDNKQLEISKLIEESISLKQQSEHLLEVAKHAVEIAIEQDEDAAMEYINRNN